MKSIRILLDGIVDYAGLFPPASLELHHTVGNYDRYLQHEHSWMLGRLVLPVAYLRAFDNVASDLLPKGNPVYPWRISTIGSGNPVSDLEEILDFNLYHAKNENTGAAVVDSYEIKADTVEKIQRAMYLIPRSLITYFEIPIHHNLGELLDILALARARAKIRTGGTTPDAFPPLADIARFIYLCADNRVQFKATAGLHHPLRGEYKLTSEDHSPYCQMNGFLNLLFATAFARFGASEEEVRELLAEQSPAAFTFDDEGIQWRTHRITVEQLSYIREKIFVSIGSCSFEEPVTDLNQLGLL